MTIKECLDMCDRLRPNVIEKEIKISWLSQHDENLYNTLLKKYKQTPESFSAYGNDTSQQLLVEDGFSDMYLYWIIAQIDFYLSEIERYNNDILLYNQALDNFQCAFMSTHSLKEVGMKNIMR